MNPVSVTYLLSYHLGYRFDQITETLVAHKISLSTESPNVVTKRK